MQSAWKISKHPLIYNCSNLTGVVSRTYKKLYLRDLRKSYPKFVALCTRKMTSKEAKSPRTTTTNHSRQQWLKQQTSTYKRSYAKKQQKIFDKRASKLTTAFLVNTSPSSIQKAKQRSARFKSAEIAKKSPLARYHTIQKCTKERYLVKFPGGLLV